MVPTRAAGQAHDAVKAEREASAHRLAALRRAMGRRAVALYKAGEVGPLQVLFASSDLPEMLVRMGQLRRLLAYDADLVARTAAEYVRAQALAVESKAARRQSEAAHGRMTRRNAALSAERTARAETLDAVQRGTLYAVPMRDGRMFWRLKRALPQRYYDVLARIFAQQSKR